MISTPTEIKHIKIDDDAEILKPKRPRTKFLQRYIISSDRHCFIGRVFDLRFVAYNFDSYESLSQHKDCKYAFHINGSLHALTQRVESLNLVGNMLWPKNMPSSPKLPISRYEWLVVSADVFLMRYISVVDCALLLANEIYEAGLEFHQCSIKNLKKLSIPTATIDILESIFFDQGELRAERNSRIHHGLERGFTQDDGTFRMASTLEHRVNGVRGSDRFGRRINVERSFKEGLVELQREFNQVTRKLERQLNKLYDEFGREFESRFVDRYGGPFPRIKVSYARKK